jgi:hypothetical protein
MNGTVVLGRDICEYFRGRNVVLASVIRHVQIKFGSSIDREPDLATILLKPPCLGE